MLAKALQTAPCWICSRACTLKQAISASYVCADAGSGPDVCTGPVANGGTLDTATVGTKSFKVEARDKVGNTTSRTVTYTVRYASTGMCQGTPGHTILQPINADGSSVFKQGSTVPATFRVRDATGASIGTDGVVTSFRIVRTTQGTAVQEVNEVVESTTPHTEFRWTGDQWRFNISTKELQPATTYYYRISLNDGSTIEFNFGLR